MTRKINGCAHMIVRKGKVVNVFTHLDRMPEDGVVHLKGHKIYSFSEFKKSHILDHGELKKRRKKVIISTFDLPPEIIDKIGREPGAGNRLLH